MEHKKQMKIKNINPAGNFACVDLEATCCNEGSIGKYDSEIIEIGAVAFDSDGKVVSEFERFIKPVVHKRLKPFCIQLTGITQEMVDNANYASTVFREFREWMVEYNIQVWGSWGLYDRKAFPRHAELLRIKSPIEDFVYVNYKNVVARINGHKPRGMQRALQYYNMEFEGEHHRGIDDARNLLRILNATEHVRIGIVEAGNDYLLSLKATDRKNAS